jgi:hypothetical protein
MSNNSHEGRLCDLYDIREFLSIRKLLNEPKDNEGSGFTIGDVIEDLIYKTEEEESNPLDRQ